MIRVYVKKKSNYPVSTPKIKSRLSSFLEDKGIVSDADVSLAFVDEEEMLGLAKKYLREKGSVHNVLSFPYLEGDKVFLNPPDGTLHLGEIVVCFPKVIEEAKKEGKTIEEKVMELIEHAGLHLLGVHHD